MRRLDLSVLRGTHQRSASRVATTHRLVYPALLATPSLEVAVPTYAAEPGPALAEVVLTGVRSPNRLGVVSAIGCTLLIGVYAAILVAGMSSLESQQQPIGDPFFSLLEIIIIVLAPLMVVLMGAVHAWAPIEAKASTLLAVVFAGLLAGVTCSVHTVILLVGRHAAASGVAGLPMFFSFAWPSVPYALDILAWDVFFALAVLFAAPAFSERGLASWIRALLIGSGALALAGLAGIATGDMGLRIIGVVGYVGVFPVATVLMAILFHRAIPRETS